MSEDRWEPKIAAERLAEYHAELLDFVGRVDQGVSTADLFYIADKARVVARAAQRIGELAQELIDEDTSLGGYVPLIEDYLQRAGRNYRVIRALHPEESP